MTRDADSLFLAARSRPDAERAAFLDGACGDDRELRAKVEALLSADAEAGSFLVPNDDLDATIPKSQPGGSLSSGAERAGQIIGRYKLLQQIGEGGFGSVFMAEQQKPVQRKVALKIIKLGMDTRQVIARFEAERQALALMDHPNIAKVLDAGATETGRPYFVMELVRGEPIVEYCDRNNLSISDRLMLFDQACSAIQHAHSKGVIHRDIKPSNILVATQDGRPNAKVIDFGIAKATASRLTEMTLFTEHQQLIGTPQYMSPEQAEGSLDIDTRTDVYSLGVLLYELLTGTTPFSPKELRAAGYAEIQRIIREVEPPRPSTRLSQNTATLASVAAQRKVEPKKLGVLVRGELDWIVMKALDKDRQRRYETANGLAMDIRRCLAGEAVVAAPPSTAYRFKKFVRRNRVMVTAGSAVAASLLIGAIAFAWQASVAREQRDLAVSARAAADEQRDRAVAAEKESTKRAAELRQVSEFQAAMLAGIDRTKAGMLLTNDVLARHSAALDKAGVPEPERDAHRQAFAAEWQRVNAVDAAVGIIDREILAPAVQAVDKQFDDQPLVRAQLRLVLASLFSTLGRHDAAQPLAEQVVATRRHELGEKHADTLRALIKLGWIYLEQARHADAEQCFREALTLGRAALGDDHEISRGAESRLVNALMYRGKPGEAESHARDVYERDLRLFGENAPETLGSMNDLALVLVELGKNAEAGRLMKAVMESERRNRGNDDPSTLTAIANYSYFAPPAEQEALVREVLEGRRRVLGEEHFETIWAISMLAAFLVEEGKLSEAEALYREAISRMRRVRGEDHTNTISLARGLGGVLRREGKTAEAETVLREALDKCRRLYGPLVPESTSLLNELVRLLRQEGRNAEALPLLREALGIYRAAFPAGNPSLLSVQRNLADLYAADGKADEALPLLREVLASSRATLPEGSSELAVLLAELGKAMLKLRLWDEAEPLIRECLTIRETTGPDDWRTFNARSLLGEALVGRNKFAEAEPLLLEGCKGLKDREAAIPPEVKVLCISDALERLEKLYQAWDKAEPDKGYGARAAGWRAKLEPTPKAGPEGGGE